MAVSTKPAILKLYKDSTRLPKKLAKESVVLNDELSKSSDMALRNNHVWGSPNMAQPCMTKTGQGRNQQLRHRRAALVVTWLGSEKLRRDEMNSQGLHTCE